MKQEFLPGRKPLRYLLLALIALWVLYRLEELGVFK